MHESSLSPNTPGNPKTVPPANSEPLSLGDRLADRVTAIGGSWKFIIVLFCIVTVWVAINSFWLIAGKSFDPYPYILLNLVFSMLTAFLAPAILMSQNRQTEQDRQNFLHDFEVNVKTEQNILQLHQKIDRLAEQQEDLRKMILQLSKKE